MSARALKRGAGWMLHTYTGDAGTVSGVPRAVEAPPAEEALARIWAALDPNVRVLALVGRVGSAKPVATVA